MPRIPSSNFNKMLPPPPPPSGGEVGSWDSLRDTAKQAPTITPEASEVLIGVVDKWIGRGAMYNSLDRILGDDNTPEVSEELFRDTYLKKDGSFSQHLIGRLREKVFFDDEFDDIDYELVCEAAADMIRVASGGVEGVNAAAIGLNVFRDLQLPLPMLKRAVEMCPREASHVIAEMVSKKRGEVIHTGKGKEIVIQVAEHIAETPATQWRMLAMKDEMIAHDVYKLYGGIDSEYEDIGQEAIESIVKNIPNLESILFSLRNAEYQATVKAEISKEAAFAESEKITKEARELIRSATIPMIMDAAETFPSSIGYILDRTVAYELKDDVLTYSYNSDAGCLYKTFTTIVKRYIDNVLNFDKVAEFTLMGLDDFGMTRGSLENMKKVIYAQGKERRGLESEGILVKIVARADHNDVNSSAHEENRVLPGELYFRAGSYNDIEVIDAALERLRLPISNMVISAHGGSRGMMLGHELLVPLDPHGFDAESSRSGKTVGSIIRRLDRRGKLVLLSCSQGEQHGVKSKIEKTIREWLRIEKSMARLAADMFGVTVIASPDVMHLETPERGGAYRFASEDGQIRHIEVPPGERLVKKTGDVILS